MCSRGSRVVLVVSQGAPTAVFLRSSASAAVSYTRQQTQIVLFVVPWFYGMDTSGRGNSSFSRSPYGHQIKTAASFSLVFARNE